MHALLLRLTIFSNWKISINNHPSEFVDCRNKIPVLIDLPAEVVSSQRYIWNLIKNIGDKT